jgi:lactate dehydrogenase-like 2-hydroxyacid dehydrogenase
LFLADGGGKPAPARKLTGAFAQADWYTDGVFLRAELLTMNTVVLTPHIASGTAQKRQAMADLAFANLEAYFAGKPVPTPAPR